MNRFNLLIDCINVMLLFPINQIYAFILMWLNRYGTSEKADYSKTQGKICKQKRKKRPEAFLEFQMMSTKFQN